MTYRAPDVPMSPFVARNAAAFCRQALECAMREWAIEDAEAVLFETERILEGL